MSVPPGFAHLDRLTDEVGLFEHALHTEPRREHGYCTDDVARALLVVVRSPWRAALGRLEGVYSAFVLEAQRPDGRFHNRRSTGGTWCDEVGSDDAQARALQALAAGAAASRTEAERRLWRERFHRGASSFASPSLRACAGAAIAGALLLEADPADAEARALVVRMTPRLGPVPQGGWPWPEPRLAWGNAIVPEARIAAGMVLRDPGLVAEGLRQLEWLLEVESLPGTFSFTPVGGWGPGEPRPGFDQQPIEAAALAAACERGLAATGDAAWRERLALLADWFHGANDVGIALADPATGGCCDGLEPGGRNENRGAESTIAFLATMQAATRAGARRPGARPAATAQPAAGTGAAGIVDRSAATIARPSTIAAPTQRSAAPYVR